MPQFDYFISHSAATKELARLLYYTGHMNCLSPWYDERLLTLGDSLDQELKAGIDNSNCFVLLYNEPASQGAGVKFEMNEAKARKERDESFRIIVVRLDDTAPSLEN